MAFLLQITETRMPDALLEAGGSSVLQTAASASPTITVHGSALQTHQVPTREHTTEYPQPLIQTLWGHMCFRIHHFLDVCTFMDLTGIYYILCRAQVKSRLEMIISAAKVMNVHLCGGPYRL